MVQIGYRDAFGVILANEDKLMELDPNAKPLIYISQLPNGKLQTALYKEGMTHEGFGLVIADLIRHVGRAYRVSEDEVFEWVKKEMDKPTTPIESMRGYL